MKIIHNWDADNCTATCIIKDKDLEFIGIAKCHPDDKQYAGAITGGYIAEGRAFIKMYQHTKNNVLKPQVQVLEHTLHIIKGNKNYNPKDVAARKLEQELIRKKSNLEMIKRSIQNEKDNLKKYIESKDRLHQKLAKRS